MNERRINLLALQIGTFTFRFHMFVGEGDEVFLNQMAKCRNPLALAQFSQTRYLLEHGAIIDSDIKLKHSFGIDGRISSQAGRQLILREIFACLEQNGFRGDTGVAQISHTVCKLNTANNQCFQIGGHILFFSSGAQFEIVLAVTHGH